MLVGKILKKRSRTFPMMVEAVTARTFLKTVSTGIVFRVLFLTKKLLVLSLKKEQNKQANQYAKNGKKVRLYIFKIFVKCLKEIKNKIK